MYLLSKCSFAYTTTRLHPSLFFRLAHQTIAHGTSFKINAKDKITRTKERKRVAHLQRPFVATIGLRKTKRNHLSLEKKGVALDRYSE